MLDTLFIISIGELGTHLLEGVARSGLFRRIVVGSRSADKAQMRINNALIGAGIEDHFPTLEAVAFDLNNPASAKTLSQMNPDIVFSAPSLMPWWKLSTPNSEDLPFAGYMSLHLAPMAALRQRMVEADYRGIWIGASYPDVINPMLVASGFGPISGVGNVQEPIAKIQSGIARDMGVDAGDVKVRLVAQHAFEYYAFQAEGSAELPPYLLEIMVDGQDVSDRGDAILKEPFLFPFDLHFNRLTASAGLMALRGFSGDGRSELHLPGCNGLVGGYPVAIEDGKISLNLPDAWSEEMAVEVNMKSLPWDGIESFDPDGTVRFTTETVTALKALTGEDIISVNPHTAADQAKLLLSALA